MDDLIEQNNHSTNDNDLEENIKLQKCWRYGKTTKLLSCIA